MRKINKLTLALLLCGSALGNLAQAADSTARISKPVQDEIATMDADGDGKISASEHAAGAKAMFDDMDVNKDAMVTVEEMDAKHAKMPRKAGEMSSAEKIAVIDSDKNGVLSAEEHAAGSRQMFDKMDKDKDGFVSAAEMQAGHDEMMSKKQA
ncbi:MAG: hypothetical protein ABI411_00785 [Tahibacter sp.]